MLRQETSVDRPIDCLLVDDNEQWARFVAADLERESDDLHVSVATGASEALKRLRGSDSYDCLVTDYQMPDENGIQLLESVRENGWEIPVLLLTGEGDENVAARAIKKGASDYLIKNPKSDQTALFEQRIVTAVEQHRLQRSIRESEERYRTVTEQSSDAIMIVQDGKPIFWNQRLAEIAGYEPLEGNTFDAVETLVHPEDRAAVRAAIEGWFDSSATDTLQETRIVTQTDQVRHWELAGRAITYEEKPAVLISARDVTQQKRQKRELNWEKELNRNIQQALVESRTREDLESAICSDLHHYGYTLAWCGRVREGELEPSGVEGEGTYTESVTFSLDDTTETEPTVRAAREQKPVFINDVTDLSATDWREAAVEAGFHSIAALPLVHEDVLYGVLAVYDRRPSRFDEIEQTLLQSLAETVAFAIHGIETKRALSSQRVVELSLGLPGTEYYLNEIMQSVKEKNDESRITVNGTVPDGNGRTIQYLTVENMAEDEVRTAVYDHPAVVDVESVWESNDRSRFSVVLDAPCPESVLADLGAVVRETVVHPAGATLHVEVTTTKDRGRVIDQLEAVYQTVSVESLVETDRQAEPQPSERSLGALTEKQATALRTAFYQGYFESPRKSSATDIADALGVAHSTFLQHLRAAQKKIFDELYG